jgi:hypothetical protein
MGQLGKALTVRCDCAFFVGIFRRGDPRVFTGGLRVRVRFLDGFLW